MIEKRLLMLACGLISLIILLLVPMQLYSGAEVNTAVGEKNKVPELRLVLTSKQNYFTVGEPITLWLAVYNDGENPATFDGRMAWPGNIYLTVWSPDLPKGQRAENYIEDLGWPLKEHLVTLPKGRSFGRKLVIGSGTDADINQMLMKPRKGHYTFRARYYSHPAKGKAGFMDLKSNTVDIDVK